MKKHIFVVIMILFVTLTSFKLKDSSGTKPETSLQPDSVGLKESEAYKMLYENQIKSNDSILKTIFYALGGLGSAVILVFASNWWFNDKKVKDVINDMDKKVVDIKKDILNDLIEKSTTLTNENIQKVNQINSKFQDDLNTINKGISLKISEYTEQIKAESKQDNKDLIVNFQKQLEMLNSNYMQQISSINSLIDSVSNSLKETIDDKDKSLKGLIESEKNSVFNEIYDIKQKVSRNEYWFWKNSEVYNNALMAQLEELEVLLNKKYSDYKYYLDGLYSTLTKLTYITKYDIVTIERILQRIPESNQDLVKQILNKVKEIKVLGEE